MQRQQNQQHLPRHQQRSPPHRQQRFRPRSQQYPCQRGGPKSGPGEQWDFGQNTPRYQEEPPVPANAPMGAVHKCSRCGRKGHLTSICGAPRWFEGNCAACGECGHLRRFCVTTRRPIHMQPHANVVTASCGGSGDSSWDHDDGGSRGVTWADQQTGGHFFALQFALTAAYPPPHYMLSSISPNNPPDSDCLDGRQRVFRAWDRLRQVRVQQAAPASRGGFPSHHQRKKTKGGVFGVTRRRFALQG